MSTLGRTIPGVGHHRLTLEELQKAAKNPDPAPPPETPAAAPAPVKARSHKRQVIPIFIAVILLTGALDYGRRWWTVGRFIEQTDDAYVAGDITVIAARVPGFVSEVLVHDNQWVKAGDLLVRLDDRDYIMRRTRAKAIMDGHTAKLASLEARRGQQASAIVAARAQSTSANAEVARAAAEVERARKLFAIDANSMSGLERSEAEHRKARAAVDGAAASVDGAQRQLSVIESEKQQILTALEQARADYDLAELDLKYTELRAPIDGVIGNRSARVGALASPGTQLLSVVARSPLWVDANFKETQIARIQAGQRATIEADVLPGKHYSGVVESLSPATGSLFSLLPANNATGNFTKIVQRVRVRIRLDEAAGKIGQLRPGLSVLAHVSVRAPGESTP
jgi:membrane fusion protein (multidrug efflux system)